VARLRPGAREESLRLMAEKMVSTFVRCRYGDPEFERLYPEKPASPTAPVSR
jgi:hypothetical protein